MHKKFFLNIHMPRELLDRIDDFRFINRFPSRAQAVRHLIQLGLSHASVKKEENPVGGKNRSNE
ncbi:MAG: ribbon-helix-helix domain-containing protein [Candidatus Hodarchaeota archaeon]